MESGYILQMSCARKVISPIFFFFSPRGKENCAFIYLDKCCFQPTITVGKMLICIAAHINEVK